jgi:hypothetical protein
MKLQMKREALDKINRRANEMSGVLTQHGTDDRGFDTVLTQQRIRMMFPGFRTTANALISKVVPAVGV